MLWLAVLLKAMAKANVKVCAMAWAQSKMKANAMDYMMAWEQANVKANVTV
jgi:hypothetical protein